MKKLKLIMFIRIISGLFLPLILTNMLILACAAQATSVPSIETPFPQTNNGLPVPYPRSSEIDSPKTSVLSPQQEVLSDQNSTSKSASPSDSVKVTEHRITVLELQKLRKQVGVPQEGLVEPKLINGHGTGLRAPTEEEWTEIAANANMVEGVSLILADQLPSSVDQSTSAWFPPIGNQDGEGSCVAWAVAYYMKTYQEAKEHGWNLSLASWEGGYTGYPTLEYQNQIISPAFVYNLINNGVDGGSGFYTAMNLICSVGASSWRTMPYNSSDYITWPSENAWREAAYYRGASTGYETMSVGTNDGILSLKNWLASENLAVIGVDANQYSRLSYNDVWTIETYTSPAVNHANTVVGYDDNIEYMENGQLRKGAFKIANSWGVGGWEQIPDGFYWISYKAMSQRIGYVMFYRDRIAYVPTLTSSFRIEHPKRAECNIVIGIGPHNNPQVSKCFNEYIQGGDHPFCPNNITLDITEFKDVVPIVRDQSFFLKVYDGGTSATGTILYFAIESSVRTASSDPPKATTDKNYVFVDIPFLNDSDVKLAWTGGKVVSGTPEDDVRPAIATDSNGFLYAAFEHYNSASGFFEIHLSRSTDHGSTWSEIQSVVDNHNLRNPSIAIDVGDNNNVFVAFEREWTLNDHDIFVLRYVGGSWSIASVANAAGNDDRYPSITCEYQYGVNDRLYISYEYVYSFDDRDLMFARSVDDGTTWSLQKLHGGWPDSNVHCQTSIATTRGSDGNDYIYIAYKWGADYNTAYDIVIDKSNNRGSTWTQQWVCDESARDKNWPSISAAHGTGTVVIAWHVYADATHLNDVQYAFSTNNGASWTAGWLAFEANANEENPIVTVDGKDSTSTVVYGSVHVAYWEDSKVCYKKASFDSPWLWTETETATDSAAYVPPAYNKPAITTYKHPDGWYLPVVTWTDQRSGSCDIYCSRAAIQRNLTVVSAHGNPNPSAGYHLYFDGDSVACNVSSPVTENGVVWYCTGWTGTGFVPFSGSDTSVTFIITQDSMITWNWVTCAFCVRADGSVYPTTAPILRNGNTYTLTKDVICSSAANCILTYRGGIILDGAGHSISGGIGSANCGVYLADYSSDIVIRNLRIYGFYCGINAAAYEMFGPYIHNVTIVGCTILSTSTGIQDGYRLAIEDASNVSACYIAGEYGIMMMGSNVISENTINASTCSMCLLCGEYDGAYNGIYHNNFIGQGNLELINGGERINTNTWDNGYPSGGNYWIYYASTDTNHDGIGDAPYVIDSYNRDSYPLMKPWKLFSDGFESGDFSAWSGTAATAGETVAVSTALFHHGKYSSRFASNGGLGSEKAYAFVNIANSSELYVRGYVYVNQSGITGNDNRFHFIVLRSGTTPLAFAGWRMTNGTVRWSIIIRDGNNPIWPTAYSTSTPVLNRWYCLELHWKQGTASGLGELWVDGTRVCQITGKNTALQGSANVVHFGLADVTNCNSTVAYCDCAKIANTCIGPEPTINSFTVSPNPFSPNTDGSKDNTTIKATFNVVVKWNLQIRNLSGTTLRTWTGTGTNLSVLWDGKNSTGFRVPDGTYTVRLSGIDMLGVTFTTNSATVTVDTKLPTVTGVTVYPTSFKPTIGQTTRINYTLSESCYVTVNVYNSTGSLKITLLNNVLKASGLNSIVWNGKDSSNITVPPGTYTIKIYVVDKAGNKATPYPIIKTVTVL